MVENTEGFNNNRTETIIQKIAKWFLSTTRTRTQINRRIIQMRRRRILIVIVCKLPRL